MAVIADTTPRRLGGAGRLFDPGGERSLEDVVGTAWGSLALRGSARCLVCGETATRDDLDLSASCPSCGSTLE
jgi:hypothetical protein